MQLDGIRVVELTRILSGPFCSMFLADMGAEVIKIEDPDGGDPIRTDALLRELGRDSATIGTLRVKGAI